MDELLPCSGFVQAHVEYLGRRRLDADLSLDVFAYRGVVRLELT